MQTHPSVVKFTYQKSSPLKQWPFSHARTNHDLPPVFVAVVAAAVTVAVAIAITVAAAVVFLVIAVFSCLFFSPSPSAFPRAVSNSLIIPANESHFASLSHQIVQPQPSLPLTASSDLAAPAPAAGTMSVAVGSSDPTTGLASLSASALPRAPPPRAGAVVGRNDEIAAWREAAPLPGLMAHHRRREWEDVVPPPREREQRRRRPEATLQISDDDDDSEVPAGRDTGTVAAPDNVDTAATAAAVFGPNGQMAQRRRRRMTPRARMEETRERRTSGRNR
ncbi:hypothetical protein V2A60_007301 [Cordyceps javanica]